MFWLPAFFFVLPTLTFGNNWFKRCFLVSCQTWLSFDAYSFCIHIKDRYNTFLFNLFSGNQGNLDQHGAQRRWRGPKSVSGRSWSTPRSSSTRTRSRRSTATAAATAGRTATRLTRAKTIRSARTAMTSSVLQTFPSANVAGAGKSDKTADF